jgi:hypothetical protein
MVESASEIRMDWRSRHAEAARDARHLCKLESPVQVIIAVMMTLATLFFIWNVGGQNDAATELTTRIGTSLGILLIFPFVYLWKLFRVGWWIERRASMLMIFFGALVAIGGAGIAATAFYQARLPKVAPLGALLPFAANPEITWDFEGLNPNISFLGVTGPGAGSLVYSFQARGTNNTDKPIKGISGTLQSDRTLKEIPVEFDFSGADGIQKRGQFSARSFFSADKHGIPFHDFGKDWASFTFSYTYNGRTFSVPINEPAVRKMVARVVFGGAFFEGDK